jgi:hypothetical protein
MVAGVATKSSAVLRVKRDRGPFSPSLSSGSIDDPSLGNMFSLGKESEGCNRPVPRSVGVVCSSSSRLGDAVTDSGVVVGLVYIRGGKTTTVHVLHR